MDNVSINPDNDPLKDKIRSYSTLNTLYHETRQEIDLMNKEICVKDNIITDLKVRLGKYERLYMTTGDGEPVAIGPSKSLVDSLCTEICKLKVKCKDVELKASRREEEIQMLIVQLRQKELELESIRCQPDHEKDQEILRLRVALEERERTEATRAILCNSLAEEAEDLRCQLGTTVKVCQELLARLDKEKKMEDVGELDQQQKAKETDSLDTSEVNSQIRHLQAENKQLKERVAYVQGLNSQWQKYDSSREDFIRGLCHRLKETTGLGSVNTGLLHHEISRLNSLLEEKMAECARLSREVDKTRRQDQDRIQTLEQQVIIYTEDFKSERADRERAQGHIDDLKERICQLKQQLIKQQGASRESRELCRVHTGHRISPRRHKDSPELLLRTAAETQQQPPAAATPLDDVWEESPDVPELQCPRCQAKFSNTETTAYMNHWDECARL